LPPILRIFPCLTGTSGSSRSAWRLIEPTREPRGPGRTAQSGGLATAQITASLTVFDRL
jgi:hypothetical protein